MRKTARHFRKLFVHELENRITPAMTIALSGTEVTITGDSGNDGLGVFLQLAGSPIQQVFLAPGVAPGDNLDLDSATPGQQKIPLSSITKLTIDLGGGQNAVTFFHNIPVPVVNISNAFNFRSFVNTAFDVVPNFDATLTDTAISFTDLPINHTYNFLTSPTVVVVGGDVGNNTLDASAVTNYNVQLAGGNGNDILRGGALPDILDGGDGDDVLEGNDGDDINTFFQNLGGNGGLYGGNGNDILRGGNGNDFLQNNESGSADGGPGIDFYLGLNAPSALITDTSFSQGVGVSIGNNIEAFRIEGDTGNNVLDASAFTLGPVWLRGFDGNDTLRGGALRDNLQGGDGDDILEGNDGDDNSVFIFVFGVNGGLYGGNGNDILRGGNGDDYLENAESGAADGGPGSDSYYGFSAPGALITDSTFLQGMGVSIGNNIEAFRIDGDSNDNVIDASAVTAFPVWLRGNAGNDTLRGGAMRDSLEGGDGDDILEGNGGDDNNVFIPVFGVNGGLRAGNGNDILRGGNGDDYLESGESGAADGGPGNDFYYGFNAPGALLTDTTFSQGAGLSIGNSIEAFRIDGDNGNNVLDASAYTLGSVWLRGNAGNDTLRGGALRDSLEGGDGDDILEGNDGDDNNVFIPVFGVNGGLRAGNGNDILRGGNGDDYLESGESGAADGGPGTDFYYGFSAPGALITDTTFSQGAGVSIGNTIEAFFIDGDNGNNVLDASAFTLGSVWLRGFGGNDTLRGGAMRDRLDGGEGDDILEGNGGDDNNVFIPVYGVNGGLRADNGNDILRGGNGDDYLESAESGAADGGPGNDYYFGFSAPSALITDTSFSQGSGVSIGNNIEAFRIDGDSKDNVIDASAVTAFPVWFRGNAGNDTLRGGAMRDRLDGNDGDDILEGNGGDDNVVFIPVFGVNGGLYADNGNDILRGGDGDDYLENGGSGAADGGLGNDYYYGYSTPNATITNTSFFMGVGVSIGNSIEAFRIDGTNGNDTFDASALTLGSVWLRGLDGNDVLRGGALRDLLVGGNGDDLLLGGPGDDDNVFIPAFGQNGGLYGEAGNDTLEGGLGNDYLDGGIDDDTLRDGPGANFIRGNTGTDTLVMLGTEAADLLLVDVGNFTVNGDKSTYIEIEMLTGDTLGGIDEGTQVNPPGLLPYTIANLEPTVFAGPDVANTDIPFIFNRAGTFKDIGNGQTWTGTADYAEGGGFEPITVDSKAQTFSLNHAYNSGGIFNVRVRITDNEGNTGEDSFLLIRPAGIQVGVSGGAQRSMISELIVSFADERFPTGNWYTFERLSPGPTPTVTSTLLSAPGQPTRIRLAFSGAGIDVGGPSITDGDYKLTLNSALILNGMGDAFDGDADGNPGGDFLFPFHRLFGDINGDRTVDGSNDFAQFGSVFGSTGPGLIAFDYNADGTVDGSTDFAQFGARFGITLPSP